MSGTREEQTVKQVTEDLKLLGFLVKSRFRKTYEADIVCESPEGEKFLIEVKTKYAPIDAVDILKLASLRKALNAKSAFMFSDSFVTGSAKKAATKENILVASPDQAGTVFSRFQGRT